MLDREYEHAERINEYELNKVDLSNSFNTIKNDLQLRVSQLEEQLNLSRKESEMTEIRLMDENNSLKNEINLKNQEQSLIISDMQRKYDILREESDRKLADAIKTYSDKISDKEKMAYKKQQLLESKNCDQAQQINTL